MIGTTNGTGEPHFETTHDVSDGVPRVLDIEIDPPITIGDKTYSTLHLEEPTGDMVERAEGELTNATGYQALRRYQFTLVALTANVPAAVVRKMRITQINEATSFLRPYISGGPEIGET